jgi:hypothetical protein
MTLQQREYLCALACREAMREWRAGKIGNQELIWRTWQAQQRYRVGEVLGDDAGCTTNNYAPSGRDSGRALA